MKIRYFILIFIAILVCIVLLDALFLHGVLVRDFATNFVYLGMDLEMVDVLLGEPVKIVSGGLGIFQSYELPFGQTFRIMHCGTGTVCVMTGPGEIPLRGMILPLLLLLVAVVEITVYYAVRARRVKLGGGINEQ